VPWLAVAFELIEEQDGVDLFAACDFLRNTFSYRLHQSAPGWEYIVDHGDCTTGAAGTASRSTTSWPAPIGSRRRSGWPSGCAPASWAGSGTRAGQARRPRGGLPGAALVRPTVPAESPEQLPTSAYFPDLGLVAARTGWRDDAVLVSFKASPGGGHKAWDTSHRINVERGWDTLNTGHHHPDANTFVLIGHGSHLAVEDGYANHKLTANHNVILVDGAGYAGEGRYHVYRDMPRRHQAHVHSVLTDDGWVHAVGRRPRCIRPSWVCCAPPDGSCSGRAAACW